MRRIEVKTGTSSNQRFSSYVLKPGDLAIGNERWRGYGVGAINAHAPNPRALERRLAASLSVVAASRAPI